uniref:Thioredoxin domain-containing protein n=2 Tax=Opuntia streptacantha TaxID=393608 RepID=A0A7C8Z171_OPUST
MVSCAMKSGVSVSGSTVAISKTIPSQQLPSSTQLYDPKLGEVAGLNSQFLGQSLVVTDQIRLNPSNPRSPANASIQGQASFGPSKAMRWWEKSIQPNMVEINSAQELVDALKNAGDRLVIVDFYSPGCGGCKSLHPKICQIAESNPDAIFLKVNHEKLKSMCHALHVHVLPFFRFYRGAEGRVCSFSCTISTINKFRTALAKQSSERCSLGPAKGLDESELLRLASMGELSLNSSTTEEKFEESVLENLEVSDPLSMASKKLEAKEENNALLISSQ